MFVVPTRDLVQVQSEQMEGCLRLEAWEGGARIWSCEFGREVELKGEKMNWLSSNSLYLKRSG